jgi:hypothetical protein
MRRFTRRDKILVGAAAVALLSLFAPWYQASVAGYTIQSVSGWGSGYGLLGALCLGLAGAYVVLERSDVALPKLRIGARLTVLSLAGLGTFLLLVRISTLPHGNAGGGLVSFHYGPAFGLVLALLAGVIETVLAALLLRGGARSVVEAESSPDAGDASVGMHP